MKVGSAVMLFVGMLIVGVACNESTDESPPVADTPQQLMENLRQSIVKGDRDAYIACFDVGEKFQPLFGATFDLLQATLKFNKKLEETFGEEGVKAAKDIGPMKELIDNGTANLTFAVDGDTARCTIPGEDVPMVLARAGDVWFLGGDYETLGDPTKQEIDQMVAQAEITTNALNKTIDLMGTKEMTLEEVGQAAYGFSMLGLQDYWDTQARKALQLPAEQEEASEDGESKENYPVANTPKQLMENLRQSHVKGNRGAYLACFNVSEKARPLLRASFDGTQATLSFHEKLQEVFGVEAAKDAMDDVIQGTVDFNTSVEGTFNAEGATEAIVNDDSIGALVDNSPANLVFAVDDDAAKCTVPGADEPVMLVRVDDVWFLDFLEPEGLGSLRQYEVDYMAVMWRVRTKALNEIADTIRAEGMTIEKIHAALAEATQRGMAELFQKQAAEAQRMMSE